MINLNKLHKVKLWTSP